MRRVFSSAPEWFTHRRSGAGGIEGTGIVEDLIASGAIVHLIFGLMVKRPA
jgi:hypothetical protein